MKENSDQQNNTLLKYCPTCGSSNEGNNRYCTCCGGLLNPQNPINQPTNNNTINQQSDNKNSTHQEEKNEIKGLLIFLGIASIVLSIFFRPLFILGFIAAVASFFSKKYRPYGISFFIVLGIGLATYVIFIIIIIGMCFAGLGGL